MPIENRPIATVLVDYRCDACGEGHYRPTGIMLLVDPPKWPHECGACGHQQTFETQYPTVGYREVQ